MIIRSESEYREAKARLQDLRDQVKRIRKDLAGRKLGAKAIAVAVSPQEALADDIAWEISLYERLKAGDVDAIPSYPPQERGKALIALRICKGWTQRQLAAALGVSEALVSRDERNEYHGISLEKYGRVLDAMGFEEHAGFKAVSDTGV